MIINSIRRETKISTAGREYSVLWLKCDGKDREFKIFDRPYITEKWQPGTRIDLVAEEREYTDDYGERRTSTNFRIAEKNDYLEERVAKLEFHLFGGTTAGQQTQPAPVQPATPRLVTNEGASEAAEKSMNIDDLPF